MIVCPYRFYRGARFAALAAVRTVAVVPSGSRLRVQPEALFAMSADDDAIGWTASVHDRANASWSGGVGARRVAMFATAHDAPAENVPFDWFDWTIPMPPYAGGYHWGRYPWGRLLAVDAERRRLWFSKDDNTTLALLRMPRVSSDIKITPATTKPAAPGALPLSDVSILAETGVRWPFTGDAAALDSHGRLVAIMADGSAGEFTEERFHAAISRRVLEGVTIPPSALALAIGRDGGCERAFVVSTDTQPRQQPLLSSFLLPSSPLATPGAIEACGPIPVSATCAYGAVRGVALVFLSSRRLLLLADDEDWKWHLHCFDLIGREWSLVADGPTPGAISTHYAYPNTHVLALAIPQRTLFLFDIACDGQGSRTLRAVDLDGLL